METGGPSYTGPVVHGPPRCWTGPQEVAGPGQEAKACDLGPRREADSTSGHFLFLTSGLPPFQFINQKYAHSGRILKAGGRLSWPVFLSPLFLPPATPPLPVVRWNKYHSCLPASPIAGQEATGSHFGSNGTTQNQTIRAKNPELTLKPLKCIQWPCERFRCCTDYRHIA